MKNVLLIDDDQAIHTLVNTILDRQQFKVTSAYDPIQALTYVRKNTPDLILMDMKMPAGGGKDLFHTLQNLPSANSVPVVVLSSLSKIEISKCLSGGKSFQVLAKPVVKLDLIDCVTNLLM